MEQPGLELRQQAPHGGGGGEQQPGLEVQQVNTVPDHSGLQVVSHGDYYNKYDQGWAQAPPAGQWQHPQVAPDNYHAAAAKGNYQTYANYQQNYPNPHGQVPIQPSPVTSESQPLADGKNGKKSKRRKWIIIGAVILALIVIIGAVLGGVLGSRSSSKKDGNEGGNQGEAQRPDEKPKPQPGGDDDAPPAKVNIRQGSSLAATALRKPDGTLETYLWYQNPDGDFQYSRWDASNPLENGSRWDAPVLVSLEQTATSEPRPQMDSELATALIIHGKDYNPQVNVWFSGNNKLGGMRINQQADVPITYDSLQNHENLFRKYPVMEGSDVTAFWPYVYFQTTNTSLMRARNGQEEEDGYVPTEKYTFNVEGEGVDLEMLPGTRLAVVPLATNYTSLVNYRSDKAVYYQNKDNKLAVFSPMRTGNDTSKVFDYDMPAKAPMAAFSTYHAGSGDDDDGGEFETVVLFKDDDDQINIAYIDFSVSDRSKVTWSQEIQKPSLFRDVDPDTNIACVTMPLSPAGADGDPVDVEELSTRDGNKCYFQRKGQLIEVRYGGGWVWTDMRAVPI